MEHRPFVGKEEGCRLRVDRIKKINTTNLKCKGISFLSEQEFLDNKFLRWGTIEATEDIYILLFFSNGIHGERALIFSKKEEKQIADLASSWPVEIESEKGIYKLNYKLDSDSNGDYASHFFDLK